MSSIWLLIFVISLLTSITTQATIEISNKQLTMAEMWQQIMKKPSTESFDFGEKPYVQTPLLSKIEAKDKNNEVDTFIYELLNDEKKGAISDKYEATVLKAITIKSKLDLKIDETILVLQNFKNLRRHIENAFTFTNRFIKNQSTNDEVKRYVVIQLDNAIKQVENSLEKFHYHQTGDSVL